MMESEWMPLVVWFLYAFKDRIENKKEVHLMR